MLTLDNGTEFTSCDFDAWAHWEGIHLDFIAPGRPVQNTYRSHYWIKGNRVKWPPVVPKANRRRTYP